MLFLKHTALSAVKRIRKELRINSSENSNVFWKSQNRFFDKALLVTLSQVNLPLFLQLFIADCIKAGLQRIWVLSHFLVGFYTNNLLSYFLHHVASINCLNAPKGFWSEKEVCSGTLLVYFYFEATSIESKMDKNAPLILDPFLVGQWKCKCIYLCYFKREIVICTYRQVKMCIHFAYNTHRIFSSTQTSQILNIKRLQCNPDWYLDNLFLRRSAFSLEKRSLLELANSFESMIWVQLALNRNKVDGTLIGL